MQNVDPHEIEKFNTLAQSWWDEKGEFALLHQLNPLRLRFIQQHINLRGKKILDVGCGGGILSEAMASAGAHVTGIDLAPQSLHVARIHQQSADFSIDYREISVEALAKELPESFDVITCMEMLEHVPEPKSIITACARLLKPKGFAFFSTLNRNLKSYLLAIIGAEYVLGLLPKGTHDYQRFIKPSELCALLRVENLNLLEMKGIHYHPIFKQFSLNADVSVNYLMATQK